MYVCILQEICNRLLNFNQFKFANPSSNLLLIQIKLLLVSRFSYIYCEKNTANEFDVLLMRCKTGYFDGTSKCVPEKPESCDIDATTPQP